MVHICSAKMGLLTLPDNNVDNEDYFDQSTAHEETVKTSNYTGFHPQIKRLHSQKIGFLETTALHDTTRWELSKAMAGVNCNKCRNVFVSVERSETDYSMYTRPAGHFVVELT
jgi:hypothetical protein